MAEPDPLVGATLPGRFRVIRPLGEGAYGVVYLAEQEGAGRPAVIKVLRQELAAGVALARFEREAQVLAALGNHHLVRLYVADRLPDGRPFLAMEYGGDRTLRDEIRRLGRLTPERALEIAGQICEALDEAHTHATKVVHRDLKPANVMLSDRSGRDFVKVVDMGLARLLEPDEPDELLSSSRNTPVGTPAYYSPEQARGAPVDERTDLYALGCVLFQMLTGSSPYRASTLPGYIHAHCYEPPLPLEELGVEGPPELRAVVYKALEKAPADRFQTAAEMREAIRRAERALRDRALARPAAVALPTPPGATPIASAPAGAAPGQPAPGSDPPAAAPSASGPGTSGPRERSVSTPPQPALASAPQAADAGRLPLGRLAIAAAALALLAFAAQRSSSNGRRGAAAALAAAEEAAARHDFQAALSLARAAAAKLPAGAEERYAREAAAQQHHQRFAEALRAGEADRALELSGSCAPPEAWHCAEVAGQRAAAVALYARAHLAAAAAALASGAREGCLAETARVLAAAPADATARALADRCAQPAAAPAPSAAPAASAPASGAAEAARTSALVARAVAASEKRDAAPATAAAAPAGPPAVDAAAARLREQARREDARGDSARAVSLLLDAERLGPSPAVLGRVYHDLLVVWLRSGEEQRTCAYLARYRPLATPDEAGILARLAHKCGGGADEER